MRKIVVVSGGFDPLHVGHVNYIQDASKHGGVVVILNSDDWLRRRKGYVFMPWNERADILMAIKGVVSVIQADDADGTVCKSLEAIKPDYFAKGGDRTIDNTPELETCNALGIEVLFGVGGGKIASSQEIVNAIR